MNTMAAVMVVFWQHLITFVVVVVAVVVVIVSHLRRTSGTIWSQ
jgi:hypothetical protein